MINTWGLKPVLEALLVPNWGLSVALPVQVNCSVIRLTVFYVCCLIRYYSIYCHCAVVHIPVICIKQIILFKGYILSGNIKYNKIMFKGAVSRDFWPLFFSWIEPIWPHDKQAKMVLLTNSFPQRYSSLKFEKFDSAQCDTAWSRIFLTS